MKQIILLLVVMSAAVFAFLFGNEADEIYPAALAILALMLAVVLIAQQGLVPQAMPTDDSTVSLIVHRAFQALGKERLGLLACKLLGAAFLASNAYHTALMTFDAQDEVQVALSVMIGGLLLLVLSRPRWHGFVRFTTIAYVVLSLGLYTYTRVAMRLAPDPGSSPITVSAKRNVYLIGNESLHSAKAYRELHGIEELPHEDYLRANGFRFYHQAFPSHSPNNHSYTDG